VETTAAQLIKMWTRARETGGRSAFDFRHQERSLVVWSWM